MERKWVWGCVLGLILGLASPILPQVPKSAPRPCVVAIMFESQMDEEYASQVSRAYDDLFKQVDKLPTEEGLRKLREGPDPLEKLPPPGGAALYHNEHRATRNLYQELNKIAEQDNLHITGRILLHGFREVEEAIKEHLGSEKAPKEEDPRSGADVVVEVNVSWLKGSIASFRKVYYRYRDKDFSISSTLISIGGDPPVKLGDHRFPSVEVVLKAVRRWRQASGTE